MKSILPGGILAAALVISGAAWAGSAGDGSGYGTQPGFGTAIANSNGCAGAGAFGAFGAGYNFGNDTSGHIVGAPGNNQNGNGANGQLTGSNNANLCGSPQGAP